MVHTRDLYAGYGGRDVLRGVSLAVPEGSAYALIGANGAGKTTLIRALMNLIVPTAGEAGLLGVDSRRLSAAELARIGYVSENQQLPGRLTVGQYLRYLRPFYPGWDPELEQSILQVFRLPLATRIRDLSHGMRMKAALACALPFKPRLLLLDEPLSGLDPLVRDELMGRLLQQADETTILISSQELTDIESATTHVGFLAEGRLLFQEPMSALSARVRAVRVTLAGEAASPAAAPRSWLNVAAAGNVLSFVDTQYSPQRLQTTLGTLLTGVRNVDVQAVALRSIFTALARAQLDEEARP
jgi:ABC-2 type transport system ATP-binding protein